MARRGTTIQTLAQNFGSSLFTVDQARELQISARRLQLAEAAGELTRVARGCFCLPDAAQDTHRSYLRKVEALLRSRPRAAAAGVSAAAIWGLPCPDPWGDWAKLPLCIASERPIEPQRGLIRYSLGPRATTIVDGLRVTDLATTACDVARQLPPPQALIVIDSVARRLARTNDRRRLGGAKVRAGVRERLLIGIDEQPRPNGRQARRTLTWADPAADSPPESYIRGYIRDAGLPAPLVNARVAGISGRGYYVDLLWPAERRGVEVDGRLKYGELDVVYREKVRQEDIEMTGTKIRRWMAEEIYRHPALLVAELGALLELARL